MCTVTLIPRGETVYITSNRDESPSRQASGLISSHAPDRHTIYYPLDDSSGGSWIALNDQGRAVCLLNGAYEPFVPSPPYRMSRGLIVTQAAMAEDTNTFLMKTELDGIAPFTLLIYEDNMLIQLTWDGQQKHISAPPFDEPRLWSSVTLYPPRVREWRKSLFEQWLDSTPHIDQDSIIAFHQMAHGDPDNDFIMNRNEIVRTLSVTGIVLMPEQASIMHLALGSEIREEIRVTYER